MSELGVSKSELAYQWIKERIIDGRFTSGYRLVLDQLARELSTSPVPIREALRRLEAEKLVSFTRNVGAQVAEFHEDEYAHTMETMAILEGCATALAAVDVPVHAIEQARAINQRMRESLDDFYPLEFTELNHEFHETLFGYCPNPQLLDLVRSTWAHLVRLRGSTFSFVPSRPHDSVAEHDQILELISAGGTDPLKLELLVRNHRLNTLHAFTERQRSTQA